MQSRFAELVTYEDHTGESPAIEQLTRHANLNSMAAHPFLWKVGDSERKAMHNIDDSRYRCKDKDASVQDELAGVNRHSSRW